MTPDDMEAGPEMDRAVSESILGIMWPDDWYRMSNQGRFKCPHPSTSNAAAHEALEKMREKGWNVVWTWEIDDEEHAVEMYKVRECGDCKQPYILMRGSTFALAACRAMLKAADA